MHFVLKGVSFVIEANKSVAFVGQHGAGKSTIAHLLLRFHDPDFGEILIDDQNIQAYKLNELRQ
jgi:ABC-type multidrug transport system fused ATPase/permease subunit